jgi:hypothetical protein
MSSDNQNNDQKIFTISQGFVKFEEFYQKTFPVSSSIAETLKQFMNDRNKDADIHKDIWLGLWNGNPNSVGLSGRIAAGYTTISDLSKICEYVPDASSCIPELEKRLNDIDEFKKNHSN